MHTDKITEKIISCGMKVSNTLGAGFLEKVYENAMVLELQKTELKVEQQKKIAVMYEGTVVGDYFADILVNDQVIIEVKALKGIDESHHAQLLNYLKATGIRVGLILNFGTSRMGIKRMVL
ncbi:MAG: GxxExxY protein [Nitrospinota bacterium]|nr:GxxExxY protein [Nitrospinota bacterium]